MRYLALATDYDGTLAANGAVSEEALDRLRRLRATGRRLVLVTGRELAELRTVFPDVGLFDRVVAENGALLYEPTTGRETLLAAAPPEAFTRVLRDRGVKPLSTGRVIVATWRPHEAEVLEAIHDLGLELQVVFNKEAVMVLPTGVNKATGLAAALKELGLSAHNVVGVGDAENDHAFLQVCECSAAVANALPALKEHADLVTAGARCAGVVELIDMLLADDLRGLASRLSRHDLVLGRREDGAEVRMAPHGVIPLVAGAPESAAYVVATLLDRLTAARYQYCAVVGGAAPDVNGRGVLLGTERQAPGVEDVGHLLASGRNAVVSLDAVRGADQPEFVGRLATIVRELRGRVGRPHWVILEGMDDLAEAPEFGDGPVAWVTADARRLPRAVPAAADPVLAVGRMSGEALAELCRAAGLSAPAPPEASAEDGALYWSRGSAGGPVRLTIEGGSAGMTTV